MSQFYHLDTGTQPTPVVKPEQRQASQYPPPPETHYPPQQPQPQRQPVRPPRKRPSIESKFGLSFLAVLALIVLIIVGATLATVNGGPSQADLNATATANANVQAVSDAATAAALQTADASSTSAAQTETALMATAVPTLQPSPTPVNDVGLSQTSGPWSITVNSIKTVVSDNEFEVPKAGDEFIDINVTTVNTDSATHDMNPLYFTIRDDSGTQYDWQGLTIAHSIYATVVGGQKLRGDLTYEIPKAVHHLMLQFDNPGDLDNSQIVQWSLHI